ncbi:MAG: hypothetical protein M1812_000450 [Candelaria pacifica]|nr:MAG: hypothetical protein M1812_000450 [Candelaria pacifica]
MMLRRLLRTQHRSFSTSLRVRVPQTPEGQTISEVAKAEGGPSKGSTSAQLQSQVAKQQNTEQATTSATITRQDYKSPEAQAISDMSKAEGGATKGSAAARMQSELRRRTNAEQGLYDDKPPKKGSASAQMQSQFMRSRNAEEGVYKINSAARPGEHQAISEVAKAEGGPTKGSESAQMQSALDKRRNAQQGTPNTTASQTDPDAQSQADRQENFAEVASDVTAKINTEPESVTPEDANLARSRETRAFGATEKGGVASTAQSLASQNEKEGTV